MINDEAKGIIKFSEGCKLIAYQCPAKIWTIGYGSTFYKDGKKVKEGDKITQDQANALFDTILEKFEKDVKKLIKVKISDNQLGAIVSFSYNVGIANLKSSTLLKKLNANDFFGTSQEFMKWNKAGGKVLNGLTIRRKKESVLFMK
jgi:lysozyme